MTVLVHAQFEVTEAEERWLNDQMDEHLTAGATATGAYNLALEQLIEDHLGSRFDLALVEELA